MNSILETDGDGSQQSTAVRQAGIPGTFSSSMVFACTFLGRRAAGGRRTACPSCPRCPSARECARAARARWRRSAARCSALRDDLLVGVEARVDRAHRDQRRQHRRARAGGDEVAGRDLELADAARDRRAHLRVAEAQPARSAAPPWRRAGWLRLRAARCRARRTRAARSRARRAGAGRARTRFART